MRRLFNALIAALIVCLIASCTHLRDNKAVVRLLFVGNSQIYVGNLPRVMDALAATNNRSAESDMIVKAGATLSDWADDGAVVRALTHRHYDYVVLQERGGDIICAFGPASCANTKSSLSALAQAAIAHGARPIMLGTYQSNPEASTALVEAERATAQQLSIGYLSVSDRLQTASKTVPEADWFYADHAHPGHDLILLEAALLYDHIYGVPPSPKGFTVQAPMYGPNARFSAPSPTTSDVHTQAVTQEHQYTANRVAAVVAIGMGETPNP